MKDIGLGILDPYTVVIVLVTLALAQALFGYQVPLDTGNATQLFVSLVIFTGYIYVARSIVRLPVAVTKTLIIYFEKFGYSIGYSIFSIRNDGCLGFLSWARDLIVTFLLLPVAILFSLFIIILNFSNEDFDQRFPSAQIKSLSEKKWLRSWLVFLDRLSVVLIAFISTLPSMQAFIKVAGFVGSILIVAIFLLKGNFSALLEDQLEKIANKKQGIKTQQEDQKVEEQPPHNPESELYVHRLGNLPVKISYCMNCGKACAENGLGQTPKLCSLECSQRWFVTWEKDWCIGEGEERVLINRLRQSGYRDINDVEKVVEELNKYPQSEEVVWALLAIVHDCDGLLLDFFDRNRIRQLIVNTTEGLRTLVTS